MDETLNPLLSEAASEEQLNSLLPKTVSDEQFQLAPPGAALPEIKP